MSFIDNLIDYVINGTPSCGSFKWYLLTGQLFEAVQRADESNSANFVALVKWINDKAPVGCYGSVEKVQKWMKTGGLIGQHGTVAAAVWQLELKQADVQAKGMSVDELVKNRIKQLQDFIGLWAGHGPECNYLDEGSPRTDCTCGYEAARVFALKGIE